MVLPETRLEINLDCELCDLSTTRTNVVWSRHNRDGDVTRQCDLMAIGEAPGETEDCTGLPFVGESGKLFELMCRSVGMTSHDFYMCLMVKCKPSELPKPTNPQIKACRPYLNYQIGQVNPKIILCLGGSVGKAIIGKDFLITKDRGKVYNIDNRKVIATFHPSYLMRFPELSDGSKKWLTWQDMIRVKELYVSY
jgi:uracil-DNA glycosylase family 4